jgi:predicted RNase H-like HicB family nuclease
MKTYGLYLESGPKHMKTMVHVPDLLGCIATGPTTGDALAATPDAIRSFFRFLRQNGERVNSTFDFKTKIVEHVAEAGRWLGNGSPYVTYALDLEPVTVRDIDLWLARFHALRETLASWGESSTAKQLDATPKGGGRTGRAILLHVVGVPGGALSAALGGAKGFSAVHGAAERGSISIPDALRRVDEMTAEVVRGTSAQQRKAVTQRPKEIRTLRKAMRHILEHDWEHLAELSRRPGGPTW